MSPGWSSLGLLALLATACAQRKPADAPAPAVTTSVPGSERQRSQKHEPPPRPPPRAPEPAQPTVTSDDAVHPALAKSRKKPGAPPRTLTLAQDRDGQARAGARRLAARWTEQARRFISFTPEALALPALTRALRGRQLAARVEPFTPRPPPADAEELPDSGKLIAMALALQLEHLGWSIAAPAVMDLVDPGALAFSPSASGPKIAARVTINGEGSFAVWPSGSPDAPATARIEATVRLAVAGRSILERQLLILRNSSGEGATTQRTQEACSAALRELVRAVVAAADPAVAAALQPR